MTKIKQKCFDAKSTFRKLCLPGSHVPSLESHWISYLFPFCMLNNCRHRGAMTKTSNRDSIQCRRFLWLLKSENNFFFGACVWAPESCRLVFCISILLQYEAPSFMFNNLNMLLLLRCVSGLFFSVYVHFW